MSIEPKRGGFGRRSRNVFGGPLEDLLDGTDDRISSAMAAATRVAEDVGSHTVCVVMTDAFLDFSKSRGNDLSTPVPAFGFPGPERGRSMVPVRATLAGGARSGTGAARGVARHS